MSESTSDNHTAARNNDDDPEHLAELLDLLRLNDPFTCSCITNADGKLVERNVPSFVQKILGFDGRAIGIKQVKPKVIKDQNPTGSDQKEVTAESSGAGGCERGDEVENSVEKPVEKPVDKAELQSQPDSNPHSTQKILRNLLVYSHYAEKEKGSGTSNSNTHNLPSIPTLQPCTSTIPNAGDGLFYAGTAKIEKGDWICIYYGKKIPLTEVFRRKKRLEEEQKESERESAEITPSAAPDLTYVMGGFGLFSIDASPHCVARYINDKFEVVIEGEGGPDIQRSTRSRRSLANVEFVKSKKVMKAVVIAKRDIEPGEELFADYGDGYWRARGMID